MKDIKDFELYLPKWCAEHHRPVPAIDVINETWKLAWDDFVKTELTEEYETRKEEYLNMKLLTGRELYVREQKEAEKEETAVNDEKSDWEKVKEIMEQ